NISKLALFAHSHKFPAGGANGWTETAQAIQGTGSDGPLILAEMTYSPFIAVCLPKSAPAMLSGPPPLILNAGLTAENEAGVAVAAPIKIKSCFTFVVMGTDTVKEVPEKLLAVASTDAGAVPFNSTTSMVE